MTQILAAVTPYGIVYAADRLVSWDPSGSGWEPYDPEANKTIVYEARDGLGVIGYAGQAYIDRTPTDQWMVERLTGLTPTGFRPGGGWPLAFGATPLWWDLGHAMHRLHLELEGAARRATSEDLANGLDVVLVGWRDGARGRTEQVAMEITRAPRSTEVRRTSLRPSPSDRWGLASAPSMRDALSPEQIRAATPQGHEAVKRLLVDAIRAKADATGTVSRDITTVLIPRSGPPALITYEREDEPARLALVRDGDHGEPEVIRSLPAAYSPYVVGGTMVCGPQIISGGLTDFCGIAVMSAPGDRDLGAMGSVARKPW